MQIAQTYGHSLASSCIQADSLRTSVLLCLLDTDRNLSRCSERVRSPADYSYTLWKRKPRLPHFSLNEFVLVSVVF